jgi:putative SOS response-associated peptidase YedK
LWAKDPTIGSKMINARSETLAEKNAFKNVYKRRRCLIPADGFYEWKLNPDGKTKQPMYIRLKGGGPLALAGLWETWGDEKGNEMRSATIITTRANTFMSSMHDRMPVMLKPTDFQRWLEQGDRPHEQLDDLLTPYPDDEMEAYPLSKNVNSPRNEGAELIQRIEPERTTLFG